RRAAPHAAAGHSRLTDAACQADGSAPPVSIQARPRDYLVRGGVGSPDDPNGVARISGPAGSAPATPVREAGCSSVGEAPPGSIQARGSGTGAKWPSPEPSR